ncbi:GNAT family N-acetyltransferase [Demetria terragena]|uniref:GNAT family N-acetyltransferase n=1 Tax=Demetria terragena TaxID=63959 RepID=UPI000363D30A|nr:hypothetical protein [Demetria terragena]
MNPGDLLAAYDQQLRTVAAESPSALSMTTIGPLRLATYLNGRGRITYRDLGGADRAQVADLVAAAVKHCADDASLNRVEWKTRGHDHAPGLENALTTAGFLADEPESIMIGEAHQLAVDVPLPDGVTLRRIHQERDVREMEEMLSSVFGGPSLADELLMQLEQDPSIELWVAEANGQMVCAGRLEPVEGTCFAGIWGGASLPAWRGQGIYRALTAARARSALAAGKTLINSDSTEFSRPILEQSGLVKVSTTTPYFWSREP